MLKACFFDLYETLITERDNGINHLDFGTPECETPAAQLGLSEDAYEKEWVTRRPGRMKGHFPDYYSVLKDICISNNLHVDDQILRSLDEKRVTEKKKPYHNINSDVIDMLNELRDKGIKIGLISNCSAEETEGLFLSPLANLMDEIVLSFKEGVSKPDLRIYEIACDRLGVKPNEAIFIGDGGANELPGAKKAGMKPFRATWFFNRQMDSDEFQQVERPIDVLEFI